MGRECRLLVPSLEVFRSMLQYYLLKYSDRIQADYHYKLKNGYEKFDFQQHIVIRNVFPIFSGNLSVSLLWCVLPSVSRTSPSVEFLLLTSTAMELQDIQNQTICQIPETGVEPVYPKGCQILSLVRLPFRHSGMLSNLYPLS